MGVPSPSARSRGAAFAVAGIAGRAATSLHPLLGKSVLVEVWGAPLSGQLELSAVSAFGAGLLIRSRRGAEGKPVLLKVAQPTEWSLDDRGFVVREAAYVSWTGRRLPRQKGCPALRLSASAERVVAVSGPAS